MKNQVLCLLMLVFMLPACNLNYVIDGVRGNGEMRSDQRNLPAFTHVVVEGSTDVVIRAGDSNQHVTVNADANILPLIKTEVHDGTLRIFTDKSYSSKGKVYVDIALQHIDGAAIEGSAGLSISSVSSDTFELRIDGSGDVMLSGTATSLAVYVNGSGDVDAKNLIAGNAGIEINGSGDVSVHSDKKLNININGSGDVEYSGNPETVKQNVSGSGSVLKK